MRKHRRRPMYYSVTSLHDGVVLAARPIRKPADRILKRDGRRVDDDHICIEFPRNGQELSDVNDEGRTRFQDIIAVALNTRRIIRELVLPQLEGLRNDLAMFQATLDRIERRESNVKKHKVAK